MIFWLGASLWVLRSFDDLVWFVWYNVGFVFFYSYKDPCCDNRLVVRSCYKSIEMYLLFIFMTILFMKKWWNEWKNKRKLRGKKKRRKEFGIDRLYVLLDTFSPCDLYVGICMNIWVVWNLKSLILLLVFGF